MGPGRDQTATEQIQRTDLHSCLEIHASIKLIDIFLHLYLNTMHL